MTRRVNIYGRLEENGEMRRLAETTEDKASAIMNEFSKQGYAFVGCVYADM